MQSIVIGEVVFSRSGRDAGRYYVVSEIVDDVFVRIVDGNVRRLEKPKLKKTKHLKGTGEVLQTLADKFVKGTKVYDAEIFSALRRYNS